MKKKVISALLALAMVASLTACGGAEAAAPATEVAPADAVTEDAGEVEEVEEVAEEAEADGELVDGKFAETRHIVVEVYDRGNDGGTDPTNNMYTKYIQDGMLADYNVEVEFKAVPRWTEVEEINNLLAAGDAPDVCLTYDYATVTTYAGMGGVIDLSEYVEQYKDNLPNLWNWLGEDNIYYDKDPSTGEIWALEGKRNNIYRIDTFVRQDWLDALGMEAPTDIDEFEAMLVAFRDNADKLLGADASKMVPFSTSYDVGWRAANIIESFLDPDITDKEFYVNGFDDRKLTENGTKEAVALLNKWYNDGLMWKDFALYPAGDTTEDDMMKAGYVGAFIHNYDYPFRNGDDSLNANLKRNVGENAKYVAIDCFKASNGKYQKFSYSAAGDRKIFFPTTNTEPLASLLYLDWISDPEHIQYLQIGDEGVTHEKLEGGAVKTISAEGDAIMNSGNNIDYTITCNGLKLTDEQATLDSLAYGYGEGETDPSVVLQAMKVASTDSIMPKAVNVGLVEAEEGLGEVLSQKRDEIYDNAVIAAVADFDTVWEDGISDYLSSGGQDIIDERSEKWDATYGSDMLP